MSSEAFVTLATTDAYSLGALVLAQSIRQVGTTRNLVVLVSKNLSDTIRKTLEQNFDEVVLVEELNSNDEKHLALLDRPELGITFTKINCWLLEKYSRCVFLDADTLILRDIDDLFEREEFSAAPDAGWPDCFNSGVFVYRPSKETFKNLVHYASQSGVSFDGGDQGLLNGFFSDWNTSDISRHLPFTYNVTSNTFYTYAPAVAKFRDEIRLVHFAGTLKPWHLTYNPQTHQLSGNLGGQHQIQQEFLLSWWKVLYERVWPQLSKHSQESDQNKSDIIHKGQMTSGVLDFGVQSTSSYGSGTADQGFQSGSVQHRRAWESGHIDYHGRDSFSHIQQQLEKNIAAQPQYHPSQQRDKTPTNDKRTTPPKQTQPTSDSAAPKPSEPTTTTTEKTHLESEKSSE